MIIFRDFILKFKIKKMGVYYFGKRASNIYYFFLISSIIISVMIKNKKKKKKKIIFFIRNKLNYSTIVIILDLFSIDKNIIV